MSNFRDLGTIAKIANVTMLRTLGGLQYKSTPPPNLSNPISGFKPFACIIDARASQQHSDFRCPQQEAGLILSSNDNIWPATVKEIAARTQIPGCKSTPVKSRIPFRLLDVLTRERLT